jgi:dTDP-4-amino-4,6-dideoxygalactose transaminase
MTLDRLEDIIKRNKDIRLLFPCPSNGQPCRMDEILDVCRRYDVMVMEDACQAHGAL